MRITRRRLRAYPEGSRRVASLEEAILKDLALQMPPFNPGVADEAPTTPFLIGYDEQHFATYFRMLDAEKSGADWQEVAWIVLHRDPDREPDRSRRAWESHLAQAH